MAYRKHLKIVHKGVEALNDYRRYRRSEKMHLAKANLSGAELSDANLHYADLKEAKLSDANLDGANLSDAILCRADLSKAILTGANLRGADLKGANLSYANITGSVLHFSKLKGCKLDYVKCDYIILWGKDEHRVPKNSNFEPGDLEKLFSRERHIEIIKQGIEEWNKWRQEYPGLAADLREANLNEADLCNADLEKSDLSGAYLSNASLSNANLIGSDLSGADLSNANLSRADLSKAILTGANFSGANFCKANFYKAHLFEVNLSGAVIDTNTSFRDVLGCQFGVNGIFCKETDSAALMKLTPPGNSMQGSNTDAIIESLTRARRLHGFSLALFGTVLLIAILNLSEIPFPWAKDVKITPDRFALLAMPISMGLLILVNFFLSDALKNSRYIQDRKSAIIIGSFPWVISRFTGEEMFDKILSFASRIVMSFHPIVYIYFLSRWKGLDLSEKFSFQIFVILILLSIIISGWTFAVSQSFQKPILFDSKTEEHRQDDLVKLTKAVELQTEALNTQTKTMTDLANLLKPKEPNNSSNTLKKK